MRTAWRIVKRRHLDSAFDSEGARRFGGRWNSPGTAVVYASETRALGLLEVVVGIGSTKPMPAYVLIPVSFDDTLITSVELAALPEVWRQSPPPAATQRIGDEWVDHAASAVLRVPSAILPAECNYLLNPAHPDFHHVRIGPPEPLPLDPRLIR